MPPDDAYATPGNSSVAIDVTTAEKVFQALYPVRSRAVHDHDAETLAAIETGAAREYDIARCNLGCPTPPVSSASVPHTFSAPEQSTYPAFFIARATRPGNQGQSVNEITVFTRVSTSDPWLVALDVTEEGGNPMLTTGSEDFGDPAPVLGQTAPSSLPGALAAYWQHWWDRGGPPTDGPLVDDALRGRGSAIAGAHTQDDQLGQQETKTYVADENVFVVAAIGGQTLTCGAVRFTGRYTPAPGHGPLFQPSDRSSWGSDVAPGSYKEIDVSGLDEDCFLIVADGRAFPLYIDPLVTTTRGQP